MFVDGTFRADLSGTDGLHDGVEFKTLGETLAAAPAWLQGKFDAKALPSEDSVRALNTAFMTDGVLLNVKPGEAPVRPAMLVFARTARRPTRSPRATSSAWKPARS